MREKRARLHTPRLHSISVRTLSQIVWRCRIEFLSSPHAHGYARTCVCVCEYVSVSVFLSWHPYRAEPRAVVPTGGGGEEHAFPRMFDCVRCRALCAHGRQPGAPGTYMGRPVTVLGVCKMARVAGGLLAQQRNHGVGGIARYAFGHVSAAMNYMVAWHAPPRTGSI